MSVPACAVLVDPLRLPKRGLLQATKDEELANKDDSKDDKTVHDNYESGLYTTKRGLSRRHNARICLTLAQPAFITGPECATWPAPM